MADKEKSTVPELVIRADEFGAVRAVKNFAKLQTDPERAAELFEIAESFRKFAEKK
jgi:hypothetical protein